VSEEKNEKIMGEFFKLITKKWGSEKKVATKFYEVCMRYEHPSNNQSFWRFILDLAKIFYEKNKCFMKDARIKYSLIICEKIKEDYIPLI